MAKKKSFAVIGLGRFGSSVAATLFQLGHDVIAVDREMEQVNDIIDHVTQAVQMDTTDERALRKLSLGDLDGVIISMGDDIRASILTTVLCKEQGAKTLICKASDDLHAKLLIKTGADKIIMPERDSGMRLAQSLSSENVLDFLELSDSYSISEMKIPSAWAGKSLREIDVRAKYGVSIIAIKRTESILLALNAGDQLKQGDLLIMIGANKDLKRIGELPA